MEWSFSVSLSVVWPLDRCPANSVENWASEPGIGFVRFVDKQEMKMRLRKPKFFTVSH